MMQDKTKGYVAGILIAVFLLYAAIQLTCNATAPERPAVESQQQSR
jgi:hypothetical protein